MPRHIRAGSNYSTLIALAATMGGWGLTFVAAARIEPPAETSKEATALAGPKVAGSTSPPTLVSREFDGKLVRLEMRPEIAAVELLTLSAEDHEKVSKLFSERAVKVHELLANNQALFLKIQAARQGGAREEMGPLLLELRPAAAALIDPPLVEQVAANLPSDQAPAYRQIVREYLQAMFAEEQGANGARRGKPAATDAMQEGKGDGSDAMKDERKSTTPPPRALNGPIPPRMEMNLLVREMGRTLQGIVQERKSRTEELIKAIDPTPEQETQIRAIIRKVGEANGLSPKPEIRGELMRQIMDVLTPEQRAKARKAMAER